MEIKLDKNFFDDIRSQTILSMKRFCISVIVISLSLSFMVSCKVQSPSLAPFVSVYKRDWSGEVLPVYIILRNYSQMFEEYAPAIQESVFGQWNVDKDTLFLSPEYVLSDKVHVITDQDIPTVTTIPHKYLMKNDCLIDLTDYSRIIPGFQDTNPDVFKRVR